MKDDLRGPAGSPAMSRPGRILAACTALLASTALIGWAFECIPLTSLIPDSVPMNPATAVCFLLSAAALWCQCSPSPRHARVAAILSTAVLLIPGLRLVACMTGWDAGVDQILFADQLDSVPFAPNRMAPNTALCFVLIALALRALDTRLGGTWRPAQALALATGFVSLLTITGYAFSAASLAQISTFIPMAPNTAIAFGLLTCGVFVVRPRDALLAVFSGTRPSSVVARRMLVASFGVPWLLGWLCKHGERADLFGSDYSASLFAVATIMVLCGLVWWNADRQNVVERQREQALQEVARSEGRLRAIVDHSTAAIYLKGIDGRYQMANSCYAAILGTDVQSLLGRTDAEATTKEIADANVAHEQAMLQATGPSQREQSFPRGDSRATYIALRFALHPSGTDVPHAICGILTDISERKELERLKDDLVSTVSHELRTPLTSLRGFAELMLHREFDAEKQREFLGIIHSEAVRLNGLIDDFLDLQRMESGSLKYDFRTIPLLPLVQETMEMLRGQSSQHDLRCLGTEDVIWVRADPARVRQVLDNLVGNAIKFSPEGGDVEVAVRVEGGSAVISVTDHGVGIPRASLDQLFKKFSRLTNAQTAQIRGTGLGLALVKELVQAHGGRVSVESEPGRGSTFAFTLPLAAAPSVAKDADVLLVDDDEAFARLLQERLAATGVLVRTVRSAEAALVALTTGHSPRVVLLDVHLAGVQDGWDLLLAVRRQPHLKDIPIVVISDSATTNKQGLALHGAEILVKPVPVEVMQDRVRSRLGKAGGRVLVVDDDPNFLLHVRTCLKGMSNIEVDCVTSGAAALANATSKFPDLLLLDLKMPGMDGFEVLHKLREDRRAVNLPVLVATAQPLTPPQRMEVQHGMATVLSKSGMGLEDLVAWVARTVMAGRTPGSPGASLQESRPTARQLAQQP